MEQQKRRKKFSPQTTATKRTEKQEQQAPIVKEEIKLSVYLEKFLKHCENQQGLTKKTIATYRAFNERFIRYLENELHITNVEKIDSDIIEIYLDYLSDVREVSKISINSTIRNIKPFFNWLTWKEHISINPFDKIKLLKTDKKRKIPLTFEQVKKIWEQPNQMTYVGIRDNLIIRLLYGTGMRVDEALSLKISDIDFDSGFIYIANSKNREDADVPIPKTLVKPLKQFIHTWLSNEDKNAYIFQNDFGDKLNPGTFQKSIKRYAKEAGIETNVSPHLLRHTFAIEFLKNGGSTASLRRQLRQKDLKVVEEYLNWLPDTVKAEHMKYNPLDNYLS
ncbi:MAG: tyrosine-type recombinase/integrase [Peptococcaceae bacterium]|nr:tyrosine-type recombinase/integrase [Peptococcaceae bacterium]